MFYKKDTGGYKEVLKGIQLKTLVHGDKTLLSEFLLARDTILPAHSHPHEQTGYLVSGEIRLTIGGETFPVSSGDSWNIPGGVEHSARIVRDSVAVEIFSPVREDYLPGRG